MLHVIKLHLFKWQDSLLLFEFIIKYDIELWVLDFLPNKKKTFEDVKLGSAKL